MPLAQVNAALAGGSGLMEWTAFRAADTLNGFDASSDDLPERFFSQPGTGGAGFEVPPLNRAEFLETRAKYYRIRGLDANGLPTRETADRLGLEWDG